MTTEEGRMSEKGWKPTTRREQAARDAEAADAIFAAEARRRVAAMDLKAWNDLFDALAEMDDPRPILLTVLGVEG